MQEAFDKWTLDTIREESGVYNWLEESRFDWGIAASQSISNILKGKTLVLITDDDRFWFANYIKSSLNKKSLDRPIIPILGIDEIYPHFSSLNGGEDLDMVEDLISTTFNDNYIYWYIGKGNSTRADIAKRDDNSFNWIMDEDFVNAYTLSSIDPYIDTKLIQLFKLFDKTLSAALFGEIDVTE